MRTRFQGACDTGKDPQRVEKAIWEWKRQYHALWNLLEVTAEDDGEPVRGTATALPGVPPGILPAIRPRVPFSHSSLLGRSSPAHWQEASAPNQDTCTTVKCRATGPAG